LTREATQLGIEFIERHIASVEELEAGVRTRKAGEVDPHPGVYPMAKNMGRIDHRQGKNQEVSPATA
jgi:hypothetical protein